MFFRLGHHQLRALVDGIARTVPVDDHAIDAPVDHVRNLVMDLIGIGGTVANIDMLRLSPPQQQVSIDLRSGAPVKQRMHIDFADIACAQVSIGKRGKTIRGAGVVVGLRAQCRGRHNERITGPSKNGESQKQNGNCNYVTTHETSGE